LSDRLPQLLTLDIPLRKQLVRFRLMEPLDSCRETLCERLLNCTYDKPFVVERGARRMLHFDLYAVQSAMDLRYPDQLSLAYTRKMMAFLLFSGAPARILMLGLGGGSLAKFCYRRLPGAKITAVEVDPDVVALREVFQVPRDDERFRVICTEGVNYLAGLRQSKDVILADACDRVGVAPECDTPEFYLQAYRALSWGGVFVTNLCADMRDCAIHIGRIRAVFGENSVTLQVRTEGNIIVLAIKEPRPMLDWPRLASSAVALRRRFGLDFPRYVRRARQRYLDQQGFANREPVP
jgi:spermidine synthase